MRVSHTETSALGERLISGKNGIRIVLFACLVLFASGAAVEAQTKQDEESLRSLPQAFSNGFNKRDARQLAAIMAPNVDFVTVGLTWLQGREDFETYHSRLFSGRFKDVWYKVLETHVRFMRPDLALVRHSWTIQGDKNADGSARPQRFGLMTMIAEKRDGAWLVGAVQNTNGPTGVAAITPEAEGIRTPPIVVPRPK